MNKADIEEWRQSLRFTAKDANEVDELCDLALRGLEAGEPTNREKIYGPLLGKIADEPVAVVYVADSMPEGTHGRLMSWLVNPVNLPNETKLYASAPSGMVAELHEADVWLAVESHELELAALRSKVAELDAANVGLAQESHDLQQICRDAYEVWAGSEGIPAPQTAAEAYLLSLLEQMRDEVKRGLK